MQTYKRHYPDFIVCDFCGRETRGKIEATDPESVKCTCCNMELTKVSDSVVVNGEWDEPISDPSHTTDNFNQGKLFKQKQLVNCFLVGPEGLEPPTKALGGL